MGQLQPNKKGNFLSSRKPGDFLAFLLDLGFDVPAKKKEGKGDSPEMQAELYQTWFNLKNHFSSKFSFKGRISQMFCVK